MSLLMIGRGDCHLGMTKTDANGNVVEQSSAKWEPNDEGGCVAVCSVDPDKLEPTEAAEVFGDWDAAHYLKRVLEKLGRAACECSGLQSHPGKSNVRWSQRRFLL